MKNRIKLTGRLLTLHEAFKSAETYTRNRAIRLWVITHLLIPKARRKYLYLCFNYLKWVDDFVDNPSNAKHEKLEFTENQLKLLTDLSNREKVELKSNGEYFLYYFVEYANSVNNYDLIAEVRNSMESIKMDAERLNNNGIFSISELHQYFDKVVQPVFNLTYIFLLPTVKVHKDDKYIGRFVWKVLILRDFFEDYDSGYINISKEEIEKYKLDVSSLKKDINRIQWIKDKYPEYIKTLNEDILIFKSLPLKVKLFWSPIYPYMILEFLRIQMYDYNFGVKHKKNFKNELKVYSQSFSFNLKFLFKIFFRHLI